MLGYLKSEINPIWITQYKDTIFECIKPPVADFSESEFKGDAYFDFVDCRGKILFNEATFRDDTSFDEAVISEGVFEKTIFKKTATFKNTNFQQEPTFNRTSFNNATFEGESKEYIIRNGAIFTRMKIKDKVYFEFVDLTKASFLETDLRKCDFEFCRWLEPPQPKWKKAIKTKFKLPFREHPVLYDETKRGINRHAQENNFKKIELLYRKLKQKYVSEFSEPEISKWHYAEKDISRKNRGQYWRYIGILFFYWLLSGYGERPMRAFILLCVFLILLAKILSWEIHTAVAFLFYLKKDYEGMQLITFLGATFLFLFKWVCLLLH